MPATKTHQELLAEFADCSISQLKALRSINQRSIQANNELLARQEA